MDIFSNNNELLVFLICLSPVLLFSIMLGSHNIIEQRLTRRLKQLIRTQICVQCNEILGVKAIDLANDVYKEQMAELHERADENNVKLRLAPRDLFVKCTNCGCKYDYSKASNMIIVLRDA